MAGEVDGSSKIRIRHSLNDNFVPSKTLMAISHIRSSLHSVEYHFTYQKIDQWVSHYSDDEARNFVLQFEREICSWLAEKFCSFCRTSCGIENNCQDLKRENLSPPSFFILSKSFLFSFSEKKLHWEMIDVKSCTMPDHKIKSEKLKTKTQFAVFLPPKEDLP